MTLSSASSSAQPPGQSTPHPRRPWPAKFRDACRGLKLGVRGHSSFFVHFFFTALVLTAGIVLRCKMVDWCILLLCIGFVLTAELFNSAIETLFRQFDERFKSKAYHCLDISAGAVLLASIVAAIVGLVVLGARLAELLEWSASLPHP